MVSASGFACRLARESFLDFSVGFQLSIQRRKERVPGFFVQS